jgi:hypothetical protein
MNNVSRMKYCMLYIGSGMVGYKVAVSAWLWAQILNLLQYLAPVLLPHQVRLDFLSCSNQSIAGTKVPLFNQYR